LAAKQHAPNSPENRAKRAFKALSGLRSTIYTRLVDYVLLNRSRLREEASGQDLASYTHQQLDELFLTKMNILDRAMSEVARPEPREGQTTTTTYETVEVIAKREELPQKIADALAERGESDFLDLCVLRADEHSAEVLLILAREDQDVPVAQVRTDEKQDEQSGPSGPSGQSNKGGLGGMGGLGGIGGSKNLGDLGSDDVPNGL
jgi:hypothetical protein